MALESGLPLVFLSNQPAINAVDVSLVINVPKLQWRLIELLFNTLRLSPTRRIEDSVSNFHRLDCRTLSNLKTVVEVLDDGGGFPLLRGR